MPAAPTVFHGRLITPANYGDKYLYEVTHSGPGVVRTGISPQIANGFTKFTLHYVKGTGSTTATELWDLTLLFRNSPPREITVEVWLDGKLAPNTPPDRPTVSDGM